MLEMLEMYYNDKNQTSEIVKRLKRDSCPEANAKIKYSLKKY